LAIGFILGFVYFLLRPSQEIRALALVMKALKDIPLDAPPLVLALTIFYHNAFASGLAVGAGVLPFLCLPVLDPLVNGAALGLLASISKHQGLNVPLLFLRSVVPHGIVELPAVLYATSVGIFISLSLSKRLVAAVRRKRVSAGPGQEPPAGGGEGEKEDAGRKDMPPDRRCFTPAVRSFGLVVLPLLLLAAFIEAFVTPLFR
ncbi:MAG TPA: stage II sporulation protein M, partial [Burkholderiales bacterium]|nr:stage II sporulation protein M [Burkholderiales bacterium]